MAQGGRGDVPKRGGRGDGMTVILLAIFGFGWSLGLISGYFIWGSML